MFRSVWNLFLAIIAEPAKDNEKMYGTANAPIKHFYPNPENIQDFSKEEIRIYASGLAQFLLEKNTLEPNKSN
jgi:hypothetical protein